MCILYRMKIPIGMTLEVPDKPGRWATWSKAAVSPGAWFLVPADDEAKASGEKYLTARLAENDKGRVAVKKLL